MHSSIWNCKRIIVSANPIDHVLWAAENGELETLRELITKQPGLVHATDSDGYTPLHRAAYSNHVNVISYLLSVGANVGAKTELGWTPLHSACNWNNYASAARLLAAGSNPGALSDGGIKYLIFFKLNFLIKVVFKIRQPVSFLLFMITTFMSNITCLAYTIHIGYVPLHFVVKKKKSFK